jgi:uncharacterized protein YjbI with pentapeptide repeats
MIEKQGIEENQQQLINTLSFEEYLDTKRKIYVLGKSEVIDIIDDDFLNLLKQLKTSYRSPEMNSDYFINELKVYNGDFDGETNNSFVFEKNKFIKTWFSNMSFTNCTFYNVYFDDCGFSNVLFYGCSFVQCNFLKSKFKTITFDNCDFNLTSMIEVDLLRSTFLFSNVRDIHFKNCKNKRSNS